MRGQRQDQGAPCVARAAQEAPPRRPVSLGTDAAPGRINEDRVDVGPSWVLVLDGATAPRGVDSGCRHSVGWLVDRLAAGLKRFLTLTPDAPLPDLLAGAIDAVRDEHGVGCDLGNPDSPSATVSVLRERAGFVDHLVLADSPILLDTGIRLHVVNDDRLEHLPGYTVDVVRAHRNQPGGFWVASTTPDAAYEALTGTLPVGDVRRAALVTDGVSRYVDLLGLGDWNDLLDALDDRGPEAVIGAIRAAETTVLGADPRDHRGRRVKQHDDATAAFVDFRTRCSR